MTRLDPIAHDYLHAWRTRGLSMSQADELATELGFHPTEVWGQDWEEA